MKPTRPIHHVAILVPNAEAWADRCQRLLGWDRFHDVTLTGEAAAQTGRFFGVDDVATAHTVVIQSPGEYWAMLEFVNLRSDDGAMIPAATTSPGKHLVSFAVADLDGAVARAKDLDFEVLEGPVRVQTGDWGLRAVTFRAWDGGLLSFSQFEPRND